MIENIKGEDIIEADLRGEPTTVCICGSLLWDLTVKFDNESKEIALYFMTMRCTLCGSLATAPIPE